MLNRLLFCFLFLTGCSVFKSTKKIVSIDNNLVEYVNDFVNESKLYGKPVVIDSLFVYFVPRLPGSTVALCYMTGIMGDGIPTVQIDREFWTGASQTTKEVIIFHELGHCVLFREHLDTWNKGIATSIMYPYIESDYMYSNNWNYYMYELFHGH